MPTQQENSCFPFSWNSKCRVAFQLYLTSASLSAPQEEPWKSMERGCTVTHPQLRDISHTNIVASSWDPLGHQEFHWFATVPQFVADNLHFWGCITALYKHKVWVCHSIHLYILCMSWTHCLGTKTDTEELLVMLHEFRSGFFICLFDGKIFNFCWR